MNGISSLASDAVLSSSFDRQWDGFPLVLEFVFFHKAVKAELQNIHCEALSLGGDSKGAGVSTLLRKYEFFRTVYKFHSSAEDEVIYPALDSKVKNVAHAYSFEHRVEGNLFEEMSELLAKCASETGEEYTKLVQRLICCAETLHITLHHHLSKEEEQVFPLFMNHFSAKEQADLVWEFLCCIPVSLLEDLLPWIASYLTAEERKLMVRYMLLIVPEQHLLKQVVETWLAKTEFRHESNAMNSKDVPENSNIFGSYWSSRSISQCDVADSFHSTDSEQINVERFSNVNSEDIGYIENNFENHESVADLKSVDGEDDDTKIQFPINHLLVWHKAIRKELEEFVSEAKRISDSAILSLSDLLSFVEKYRFLADVCFFHSTAEDKVVFPAVDKKIKISTSFALEHAQEEKHFLGVGRILQSAQLRVQKGNVDTVDLLSDLCLQTETVVHHIQNHFLDEENRVLPLLRKYCTVEEQRALVYQSLLVMPLKLLEQVLPWVMTLISDEEAEDMVKNIQLAAPKVDAALVELLTTWARKQNNPLSTLNSNSILPQLDSFSPTKQSLPIDTDPTHSLHPNRKEGEGYSTDSLIPGKPTLVHPESPSNSESSFDDSTDVCHSRPLKRLKEGKDENGGDSRFGELHTHATLHPPTSSSAMISTSSHGVHSSVSAGFKTLSLGHSNSISTSNPGSNAFLKLGFKFDDSNPHTSSHKPIDTIFQFHQAIRKDLKNLSTSSANLADCDEDTLRQFSGKFQFLWGLYRAHSNAEDDIVFPALESKEALLNVSHSYTIDHKQEEQYFEDIAKVLAELRALSSKISSLESTLSLNTDTEAGVAEGEDERRKERSLLKSQKKELGDRLYRMCTSVQVSLDLHVSREEVELWPLFEVHFTVEEQDQIVGKIIGSTGAEVLQAMLPWIASALSEEEQNRMMDTWRQATRNTMFDQWLSAWWNESSSKGSLNPTSSPSPFPQEEEIDGVESLQIVMDYLHGNGSSRAASTNPSQDSEAYAHVETETKDCESIQNCHDIPGQARDYQNSNLSIENTHVKSHEDGNDKENCVPVLNPTTPETDSTDESKYLSSDSNHEILKEKNLEGKSRQAFKPGWREIFRMNQQELEAAVHKVSSDKSLDPRRKAYLMQNLMTSRWIVAQQKSHTEDDFKTDENKLSGRYVTYHDEETKSFGCEHYKRNCKLVAECCGKIVTCRFCHDRMNEHSMNWQVTKNMMCMFCLTIQPVAQHCSTPTCNNVPMARYYCPICKLFNDDERDIYHCPFCNICRVGKGLGIDYFHCMKCNACMSTSLKKHKCREKGLESNCPICHDFLFTSNTPVKALACGHFMHSACFQAYTRMHYTCPICSKSLGDMAVYFGMLDAILASEQLPDEFKDIKQDILCNDCARKGDSKFHWLYHKCSHCGSYNTRVI